MPPSHHGSDPTGGALKRNERISVAPGKGDESDVLELGGALLDDGDLDGHWGLSGGMECEQG